MQHEAGDYVCRWSWKTWRYGRVLKVNCFKFITIELAPWIFDPDKGHWRPDGEKCVKRIMRVA